MKRILAIATPLLVLASCSDFNADAMNHEELEKIVKQYKELKKENSGDGSRYKYRDLADWGSDVILHNPQSVKTAPPALQRSFLEAFEDCWANAGYSKNPYITLKVQYSAAKQAASRQAEAKPTASAKQGTKPARNATKHDSPKKSAQGSRKQNKAATSRPEPKKEDLYNKAKAQPDNLDFKAKIFRS